METITIKLQLEPSELDLLRKNAQKLNLSLDALVKKLLTKHVIENRPQKLNKAPDFMGIVDLGNSEITQKMKKSSPDKLRTVNLNGQFDDMNIRERAYE